MRRCLVLLLSVTSSDVHGLALSPFNRRKFVQAAASSTAGLLTIPSSSSAANAADTSYNQQFPSLFDPIYGKASDKKTIKRQISPNVFLLEQSLALGPLETPLRCTVIRLSDQSLWVHCPLAPTEEFFQLVESCCGQGDKACKISHIVVPTYALEHKIFTKDALERWNDAKLWVSPNQFSFPLRSMSDEFIWGRSADGVLFDSDLSTDYRQPPWVDEISYQSLVAGTFAIGGIPTQLCETAFYHKESKCMIVTDSVAQIPRDPPPEELSTPENLLLISKRSTSDPLPEDSPENRLIGWKKNCLLISFFFPEHEEFDPNKLGVVTWTDGWEDNFDKLSGRLLVPPVVRTLLYRQNPAKVKEWVEAVSDRWDFQSIIPAHWDAPIATTPAEFRDCFRFLENDSADPFPANDLKRGLKPLADLALKTLS